MTAPPRALRASRVGAGLSLACALHCLAAPALLTALPLGGLGLSVTSAAEAALVVASVLSAVLGLCWGVHVHGERRVFAGLVAALGLFLASLSGGGESEVSLSAAGSAVLAASLLLNHRLCRTCADCATTVSAP